MTLHDGLVPDVSLECPAPSKVAQSLCQQHCDTKDFIGLCLCIYICGGVFISVSLGFTILLVMLVH